MVALDSVQVERTLFLFNLKIQSIMKKLFFMMLLCAISVCVSAQNHLTFKGVPIEGSLTSFVAKLQAKGFTKISSNEERAMMKGDFSGDSRTILIYATKTTKQVYAVCVVLKESSSWSTLKSTYNEYKSSLATKYGEGDSYENFLSPYKEGDGYEMIALRAEKCLYATTFEIASGTIAIMIISANNGAVALYYTDKTNTKLSEKEQKDLISNDL